MSGVVRCPHLVGRGAEVDALRGRLASASANQGGVLFVVGEAGIGKTRLVRDGVDEARAHGARVFTGRALPASTNAPYRMVSELLMQTLRDRGTPDDPDVAAWLPAMLPLAPGLRGGGASPAAATESEAVRAEALVRLLRWAAGDRLLIAVLEDLHWADAETLAVVDYLADNLAGEPVIAVVTVRDGSSAAMDLVRRVRQRGSGMSIELGPLSADAVAAMVHGCAPLADATTVARVQATAEGVPLLVEELLAAPGIPATIGEAVRNQLAELSPDEQTVVRTAALLGRDVDWRVIGSILAVEPVVVARALDGAVVMHLLEVVDNAYRFRHALIRDAVIDTTAPPLREQLARAALRALDRNGAGVAGADGDRAELALLAGDRLRAAALLTAAGEAALRHGAPGTAVQRAGRALDVAPDDETARRARMVLVKALALAGRFDEAEGAAQPLLPGPDAAAVHVELASAAVAATRWPSAVRHLARARAVLRAGDTPARIELLSAEIALASGDVDAARFGASGALAVTDPVAEPDVVCHAWELIGRSHRLHDLHSAREAFEQAHAVAAAADLPARRLRALHELGTIDMLDAGGTQVLSEARAMASELGVLSTVAVLDLQLAGAHLQRYDIDAADAAARRSVAMCEALRLSRLDAAAHVFQACIAALRGQRDQVELATADAIRQAPDDPEVVGLVATGAAGMLELLWGSRRSALSHMNRGMAILRTAPQSPPGPYRGLWPLVVALEGGSTNAEQPDAAQALREVRDSGVSVNRVNRGYLAYAEAVAEKASAALERGDADLALFPVWRHIGRALAAEAALRDGWGEPRQWLSEARACFVSAGLTHAARHIDRLLQPQLWSPSGASLREIDVLDLLTAGLPNREIAERLHLSVRTVEKHVESLLRKSAARSRTELTAIVRERSMGENT